MSPMIMIALKALNGENVDLLAVLIAEAALVLLLAVARVLVVLVDLPARMPVKPPVDSTSYQSVCRSGPITRTASPFVPGCASIRALR